MSEGDRRAALGDDVVELLGSAADSVEKLEALVLLARSPLRGWTVAELAAELDLGRGDLAIAVSSLVQDGLVVHGPQGHRYTPLLSGRADAVASLVRAYDDDRAEVLRVMSELALERVRTSAMAAFLPPGRRGRRAPTDDGLDGA